MWKQVLPAAIAVLFAASIAIRPLYAGGFILQRHDTGTSMANCDSGHLLEQFWGGGDMHGSYPGLVIACLTPGNTAAWVLISGTSCYDDSESPKLCATRRAMHIVPFNQGGDARLHKKQPVEMRYNLIKWGMGTKCSKISARGEYEREWFWLCDRVAIHDGTAKENDRAISLPLIGNGQQQAPDPKNFQITVVATNSREPFIETAAEPEDLLPTRFATANEEDYEYRYR